jgi:spore maturation protein CgeB
LRGRWDGQRAPALQALADLGHEVVYVDQLLNLDDYRKLVRQIKFDLAVIWGSSLQNFVNSFEGVFFLEEEGLPYVSLWTDNVIKHQYILKDLNTSLHIGMFVADTQVMTQLQGLGWNNVFYLPPWHIDPDIFMPVPTVPELTCNVSFAATFNSYDAERNKWRDNWNSEMNTVADMIIQRARETSDHIDVFDIIGANWNASSVEFNKLSHAMYFEQKALAREQIIQALGPREINIVGIGSAKINLSNVIMHKGREWHDLSALFCSSAINLNLTPWPKSCHHRVFQIAASGAFVLSDWREDATALFEPDEEVVYFKSMKELPGLVDRYLAAPLEREKIAAAGRRRFLSEHTVVHRMTELSTRLYDLL